MSELSVKPTMFWIFLSLGLLFFYGGTLMTHNLCDEYVTNPIVCNSFEVFIYIIPYLMILTFLLAFITFLIYGVLQFGTAFDRKHRMLVRKEKKQRRRQERRG